MKKIKKFSEFKKKKKQKIEEEEFYSGPDKTGFSQSYPSRLKQHKPK